MKKSNFTDFTGFIIEETKAEDIDVLLEIATECNLARWSRREYEREISRKDNISFTAKKGDTIIGFITARLIIFRNESSYLNDEFSQNKGIEKTAGVNKSNKSNKSDENNKIDGDTTNECEVEIHNIAVSSLHQVQGAGKILLNSLLEALADFDKAGLWLEVRESNRQAITFYRAQHFREVSKRKNYYTQPTEDAVIMKRDMVKKQV